MGSLNEFIASQRYYANSFPERLLQIPTAFHACLDFLQTPARFPNPKINSLTALLSKLLNYQDIPLMLDQLGQPLPSFITEHQGINVFAYISVPLNFPQLVDENAAGILGRLAYLSSEGRDYYTNKMNTDAEIDVVRRAYMYEAETLLTLGRMGREEGVRLQWSSAQQEILSDFPEGIKSAPHLAYKTPPYMRPVGFG